MILHLYGNTARQQIYLTSASFINAHSCISLLVYRTTKVIIDDIDDIVDPVAETPIDAYFDLVPNELELILQK